MPNAPDSYQRSPSSDPANSGPTRQQAKYVEKIENALAQGNLTVVVGAGVSISALQAGSKEIDEGDLQRAVESMSWLGVLRHGLDYLEEEDIISSATQADNIELEAYRKILKVQPVSTDIILRAASFLKSKLESSRKLANWFDLEFEGIYDKCIDHNPNPILDAMKELYDNGARIVTTNYDDLLDKHIGASPILSDDTPALKRFFRNRNTGICHVHGVWWHSKGAVLDNMDYGRVVADEPLQQGLKNSISSSEVLLFVGTGAGLDDPNFGRLLTWAANQNEGMPQLHCVLARRGEHIDTMLNGLNVLRYGSDFGELPPFLMKIAQTKNLVGLNNGRSIKQPSARRMIDEAERGSGQRSPQEKYNILLKSLAYDGMDAQLRNVATALPTTCVWLFGHMRFEAWIDESQADDHHGFLWIKGKPGSGKSTIMKTAIAWAKGRWPTQIVISYFFNARSPNQLEKSSIGLYRSLMHQLLSAHQGIQSLFLAGFSSKERDGKVEDWTETEIQNFLLELITARHLPPLNIFVDALDEGNEDDIRQMVAFFEDIGHHSTASDMLLRICLSSRHYPRISIQKGLFIVVEDQLGHNRDIELYVQNKLHGNQGLQMSQLRQEVLRRSAGIFLWVVLVVRILNPIYDRGEELGAMMKRLESIPGRLRDLFAEILDKSIENIDECVTLLRWVLAAMRPLGPIELYLAVQQSHAPSAMDGVNVFELDSSSRYVLDRSRGLVELTKAQPPVVQFIHETVRDYLIETNVIVRQPTNLRDSYSSPTDFRKETCHVVVAEGCLQYLLHVCENAPLTQKIDTQNPLAEYAAEYWWQHACMSDGASLQTVLRLALSLLTNGSTNLLTWIQLYDIDSPWKGSDPSRAVNYLAPPLYYAASVGIPELVSNVLLLDVDPNAQGGSYGNALQAASARGHEKIVQILLERGADVDARGGEYGNALQAASARGHEKIVQMLLERGADVDARGGEYGNALQTAVAEGHEKIVQMLLERGADVNAQGGKYSNALLTASAYGHEKIVQILLKRGADVNAQGGEYGNALQMAVAEGYEKIVQMLLERGADVNPQGGEYGNALLTASAYGREKIVQILLERGADVNPQGREYGNALQMASAYGNEKIVQMLLERGADVNPQGGEYSNALQAASAYGREKIVQILLERGADVNAQGGEYGNALQTALAHGHEKIVQILIEGGADVNTQDGPYGNILQAASRVGKEKVVQMLLEQGADVNTQGGPYGNALQAASHNGHEKVVQMLLERGADVNTQGGPYGNALQAAASYVGNEKVVQMLLERGADVDARSRFWGNVVQAALAQGYEKVAQALLERIFPEDNERQSAYELSAAFLKGDETLARRLIAESAIDEAGVMKSLQVLPEFHLISKTRGRFKGKTGWKYIQLRVFGAEK